MSPQSYEIAIGIIVLICESIASASVCTIWLNKLLSCPWFETPWCSCNITGISGICKLWRLGSLLIVMLGICQLRSHGVIVNWMIQQQVWSFPAIRGWWRKSHVSVPLSSRGCCYWLPTAALNMWHMVRQTFSERCMKMQNYWIYQNKKFKCICRFQMQQM